MTAIAPKVDGHSLLVDLLERELGLMYRDDALPEAEQLPAHLWRRALGDPAHEFLDRPGKQFRSELVLSAWCLGGGKSYEMPAVLPCIVEILHAGSLIVDDIEDDAMMRRNRPALHRLVGIPKALNTGNWMYFWPFVLIQRLALPPQRKQRLVVEGMRAVERCHRGQALDIELTIPTLEQAEVPKVVRATTRLKTASLMELAAALGAVGVGASEEEIAAIRLFARMLGDGLQMLDDLGSIASAKRAHKGREDLLQSRPTWPWAWLAQASSPADYRGFVQRLEDLDDNPDGVDELASDLCEIVCETGRARIHASLLLSLAGLRDHFPDNPVIDRMEAEIARLEKSYE